MPNEWHYVHYATRAIGGVGLIMVEATCIEYGGLIDDRHLGIFDDRHVDALSRLVDICHRNGAMVGIQIVHGGRKTWKDNKGFGPIQPVAPSPIPFAPDYNVPRDLSVEEIDRLVVSFQAGARRALDAGFDVLEIHAAHGYLISEFLSPLSNHREDEYGGSLQNRMRLLKRVTEAVRQVWPERAPLFVRVSASDHVPGGMDIQQTVEVAKSVKDLGIDLVDCSAGGIVDTKVPTGPGYQVPFAHRIKREAGIPTAAVGLITTPEMADEIVRNERADLMALGRELLRHPYWALDAAAALGVDVDWPTQYRRAKR